MTYYYNLEVSYLGETYAYEIPEEEGYIPSYIGGSTRNDRDVQDAVADAFATLKRRIAEVKEWVPQNEDDPDAYFEYADLGCILVTAETYADVQAHRFPAKGEQP